MILLTLEIDGLLLSSLTWTTEGWRDTVNFNDSLLNIDFLVYFALVLTIFGAVLICRHFKQNSDAAVQCLAQATKEKEQLQQENEELRYLNAIVAHDLKSPLRAITCFSGLTLRKFGNALPEEGQKYLSFIKDSSLRLAQLIDDLPKVNILSSSDDIDRVDTKAIIHGSLDNLYTEIQQSKGVINFADQFLPRLTGHQGQFLQLFQNIIANSLKYTAPGIAPVINIDYSEGANFHLFSIEDNGIGIAAEDQDKIFQRFTRLHDNSTYEGSGLGLAYCQQIMKRIGGEISLTSSPGQGTTFFLKFPKEEAIAPQNTDVPSQKRVLGKNFITQIRAASF